MARRTAPQISDVAIYARLSVTTEESVSIERQLETAREYATLRGWTVVLERHDDGVSASRVKPEDRRGWRDVLDSSEDFQAVIVWKVDRLARRVLDFLHADEALQARGAGIVAVEDPLDMTTAQGRAFAQMLAVFGEMEAAAMSARVTAAREAILKAGRRAGGRLPFGFMNVPNPDGPGMVLAQDPERVGIVAELAARALRGESLYSLTKWLTGLGVTPRSGERTRWHDASVEAILRSPALAGMVAFRGDLLRGEDGLPVVEESIAVVSPAERRRLLQTLDAAKVPGTRQKAGHHAALLYGVVRCGSCGGLMYRATAAGKYQQYRCQQQGCPKPVGISRPSLEAHVCEIMLSERGRFPAITTEGVTPEEDAPRLVEVEAAIADTLTAMGDDQADVSALTERLAALKSERAKARAGGGEQRHTFKVTGMSVALAWRLAGENTEARRQLLLTQLDAVYIGVGGGRGRVFDAGRVTPSWKPEPPEWNDLVPNAAQVVLDAVQRQGSDREPSPSRPQTSRKGVDG